MRISACNFHNLICLVYGSLFPIELNISQVSFEQAMVAKNAGHEPFFYCAALDEFPFPKPSLETPFQRERGSDGGACGFHSFPAAGIQVFITYIYCLNMYTYIYIDMIYYLYMVHRYRHCERI